MTILSQIMYVIDSSNLFQVSISTVLLMELLVCIKEFRLFL